MVPGLRNVSLLVYSVNSMATNVMFVVYLRCFEKTAREYSKGGQDHVQRNERKEHAEGHIDI